MMLEMSTVSVAAIATHDVEAAAPDLDGLARAVRASSTCP